MGRGTRCGSVLEDGGKDEGGPGGSPTSYPCICRKREKRRTRMRAGIRVSRELAVEHEVAVTVLGVDSLISGAEFC